MLAKGVTSAKLNANLVKKCEIRCNMLEFCVIALVRAGELQKNVDWGCVASAPRGVNG